MGRVGGAFWAPSNELVRNAFCAFCTARGVPSMFDSLEVKVLYPGLVGQRVSEAQGRLAARNRLKEARTQNRDLTDRNRIEAILVGRAGTVPQSPRPP